jgi:energy-coupling factor transporter ATP-binding protein EcfA2
MTIRHRFNRDAAESARLVVKNLLPDPKIRRQTLEIVKSDIELAHSIDPASWGATLTPNRLRLNVGRGAVLTLEKGTLTAQKIQIPVAELKRNWADVKEIHQQSVEKAAHEFGSSRITNPSWRSAHSAGLIEFLREEFGEVPTPSYSTPLTAKAPFDLKTTLEAATKSANLTLPDKHIAAFYTALQTKGLVILRGPSGTGKTRLALAFCDLLPSPNNDSGEIINLDQSFRLAGKLPLPPAALQYARDGAASLVCDGQHLSAKIESGTLIFRGATRRCVLESFQNSSQLLLESEIDESGAPNFRLLPVSSSDTKRNYLFLPVQSSWNDEKSLLGYFNPLLSRYEWTPFLRFILAAHQSFQAGENFAFFVVLDEMNLARVEHYFADLLSVLESGRDKDGLTREPIRFDYDLRAGGELPPSELYLPPNLYFIGTLNDDETTHALSPKVLDRAFVLPSPSVDFTNYNPLSETNKPSPNRDLLQQFSRNHQFVRDLKPLAAAELQLEPRWRDDLQALNTLLTDEGLGFGFRVFDEIVAFINLARENGLLSVEEAFELAVEAKVLPKLSGAQIQVERALEHTNLWANERGLSKISVGIDKKMERLKREGFV